MQSLNVLYCHKMSLYLLRTVALATHLTRDLLLMEPRNLGNKRNGMKLAKITWKWTEKVLLHMYIC